MRWRAVAPTLNDIYVIENPQVFEEVVAQLQAPSAFDQKRGTAAREIPALVQVPTIVCTAGWPSVAALTLLDQLIADNPLNTLHYSGDMDLKGLQIAASLMERYPARCTPWHMDSIAYHHALQVEDILTSTARTNELQLLDTLPEPFVLWRIDLIALYLLSL